MKKVKVVWFYSNNVDEKSGQSVSCRLSAHVACQKKKNDQCHRQAPQDGVANKSTHRLYSNKVGSPGSTKPELTS